MPKRRVSTRELSDRTQYDALSSPLRLEILGQLTDSDGTSIAQVAARIGRPAVSLYYQFRKLEGAGLIEVAGRRPTAGREQTLYRPTAGRFAVPGEATDSRGRNLAERTLRAAHRMAERDFSAALAGGARSEGDDRNCYVARLHFSPSPSALVRINRHLRAIEAIASRENRRAGVAGEREHLAWTVSLLPLHGRRPTGRRDRDRRGAR